MRGYIAKSAGLRMKIRQSFAKNVVHHWRRYPRQLHLLISHGFSLEL
jgi:hypothetical protein